MRMFQHSRKRYNQVAYGSKLRYLGWGALYTVPQFVGSQSFFFSFLSSGGWGKIKLQLTTLPRIFIRVVC